VEKEEVNPKVLQKAESTGQKEGVWWRGELESDRPWGMG
jgi:hypothetical protein